MYAALQSDPNPNPTLAVAKLSNAANQKRRRIHPERGTVCAMYMSKVDPNPIMVIPMRRPNTDGITVDCYVSAGERDKSLHDGHYDSVDRTRKNPQPVST